jgi:prepilin-type N-terminal cleavage/methylation domain-containing protein
MDRRIINGAAGFTLVEIIVVLAVLAILVGVSVPVVLKIFERTAEDATREEMDNVKKALIGDARKLQGSFRSDFGLLGDIGCLPSTALGGLDRLLTQGGLPAWTFDTAKQAGAGWKGPYVTGVPGEDFKKDQWGNDYTYTPAAGACPLTATLASNGPDGQPTTADDITVNIVANETTATIRGTVKDAGGVGLSGFPVRLYYPSNGTLATSSPATTDANGNYSFSSVPFGQRAVQTNPTLVIVPGTIAVTGGANNNVDFQLRNYSGSSVTVNSINVACIAGVITDFDTVNFDGAGVDPGGEQICSVTHTLSGSGNLTFSANPTPPGPMRVIADSPDSQLPDLTIRGSGATRQVEIDDFENGNPNVNMSNRTLTVTFGLTVGGPVVFTFTTP